MSYYFLPLPETTTRRQRVTRRLSWAAGVTGMTVGAVLLTGTGGPAVVAEPAHVACPGGWCAEPVAPVVTPAAKPAAAPVQVAPKPKPAPKPVVRAPQRAVTAPKPAPVRVAPLPVVRPVKPAPAPAAPDCSTVWEDGSRGVPGCAQHVPDELGVDVGLAVRDFCDGLGDGLTVEVITQAGLSADGDMCARFGMVG